LALNILKLCIITPISGNPVIRSSKPYCCTDFIIIICHAFGKVEMDKQRNRSLLNPIILEMDPVSIRWEDKTIFLLLNRVGITN
jgi:hypothetical protein